MRPKEETAETMTDGPTLLNEVQEEYSVDDPWAVDCLWHGHTGTLCEF